MNSVTRLLSLAAAALLVALAACGGGSDDASPTPVAGSPSPTASQEPTPTPSEDTYELPPLTPFGPELAEKLHSIRDKVAEIRGLPVPELSQEGVATYEDVLQNNLDSFDDLTEEERAESDASFQAMAMLKLVPDGYTLDSFAEDYSSSIAGFYSIEEDALVLIGEPDDTISVYDEMILAHEYTHALQDAAFDLDAMQKKYEEYPSDEEGTTSYAEFTSCIIEGDASFTEYKYMEEVFGPDWFDQIEYEDTGGSDGGLPEFLARSFGFNYSECYYFVSALYDEGGWEAINDAFENPPATSEQVLDIDKYLANEVANGTMPGDLTEGILTAWTATDIGQFGAFDIQNYVETITGDYFSAYDAGQGWGSGWIRTYENGTGSFVLQLQLSFDSSDDLAEFVGAFGDILREYDVDTGSLEPSGVRHFTIAGGTYYFGAIGSPKDAENAAEIILATDQITLDRATTNLE